MKILIIVQNLPVPFDRRVWLEAQTLTEAGYQVSVISPKGKTDSRYEFLKGVHIYRYKAPTNSDGLLGYAFEFIYCWCLTFYLSLIVLFRHGFKVIHACNPAETYFLLGLFYKVFGKNLFLIIMIYLPRCILLNILQKKVGLFIGYCFYRAFDF